MGDVAGTPGARDGFWERLLPRIERADALWLAGFTAGIGIAQVVAYQPLADLVPRAVWPLVAWAIVIAVATWAVMRFTSAPRAAALFFLLATVVRTTLVAGNHAASDAFTKLVVPVMAGRPVMSQSALLVTLAELLGVLAGAWLARLSDPARTAEEPAGIGASLGWQDGAATGAVRLAVTWTATLAIVQLATALLQIGPNAFQAWAYAQDAAGPRNLSQAIGLVMLAVSLGVYFLAGYLGVKRFSAPRSVWLAFIAVSIGSYVSSLMFMPAQIAVMEPYRAEVLWALPLFALTLGIGLLGVLAPALGVWLVSGSRHVSEPSATLPAEEDDHERAGGTDG